MKRGFTGLFRTTSITGSEPVKAFLPNPLPPVPPIEINPSLQSQLDEALLWLGRLDSVSTLLPDTGLFLYTYIRKEAVLSSQIEGTQSTLSDLLLFELKETPGVPMEDAQEVSSYVAALTHGLRRIQNDELPLSNRLIKEMHKILLSKGRGADKQPGEFRTSQNWIGGTRPGNARYVPPPHEEVQNCMSDLEKFIHNQPAKPPTLVKAALAHVQFETIHPFLDGNGRIGRLLITLLFCVENVMREPLLYLSLYFKEHRQRYYDLLQLVRTEGDWEQWLEFFATAVCETAKSATITAQRLTSLVHKDRESLKFVKRGANSLLRIHEELSKHPMTSIKVLTRKTKLTTPAVTAALKRLIDMKIVREITGRQRNRIFVYDQFLRVLDV